MEVMFFLYEVFSYILYEVLVPAIDSFNSSRKPMRMKKLSQNMPLEITDTKNRMGVIWVKVFKNRPSKICGRQPLKNLKEYGLELEMEHCLDVG